MKKTIVSIVGIRPDFIRMSEIFKKLDNHFNSIVIHTGQHFDKLLSDVFFDELEIRQPDYNLGIGGPGKEHFHQLAEISVKTIELFRKENINPDLILFLGDSNSVTSAVSLKKEGYRIGHIEAGMRSGDKRMLEEINRIVCDHCSDILFVYHNNYKAKLLKEGISSNSIFVVGNTITEPVLKYSPSPLLSKKKNNIILVDIHRPENFKYPDRMINILNYCNQLSKKLKLPVKMLSFKRTMDSIENLKEHTGNIKFINLLPFKKYLETVYHAAVLISDSGSAQDETSILMTPVIVPRDFTERPESVEHHCSTMIDMNSDDIESKINHTVQFINDFPIKMSNYWLFGDDNTNTSDRIIQILLQYFDQ